MEGSVKIEAYGGLSSISNFWNYIAYEPLLHSK